MLEMEIPGGGSSGGYYLGKVFSPEGRGRIQDNSEWVLQLIRASNNQVLSIIDSVGILQNPTTDSAKYYGTLPGHINNVRLLSDNYAGIPVYLRISPRRTGLTPYGMVLKYIQSNISKSTYFEYSDSNLYFEYNCDSLENHQLDSIYFNKLITYCDSVLLANGTLSIDYLFRVFITDKSKMSYFMNRYFVHDSDNYGHKWYSELIPSAPKPNDVKQYFNGLQFDNDYGLVKITKISPTPISEN